MTTEKKMKLDLERIECLAAHLVGSHACEYTADKDDLYELLRRQESAGDDLEGIPDKSAAEYLAYMRPEVTLVMVKELKRLTLENAKLRHDLASACEELEHVQMYGN